MHPLEPLRMLCACLVITTCSPVFAQQPSLDQDDAALAYAQCMRENGYAEFPDPVPGEGIRFLINPETAPRFGKAAAACSDLAPAAFRDAEVSPEDLDALIAVAQCVREHGVPEFPDPGAEGRFDLGAIDIGPGDTRLGAALASCNHLAQGGRIVIGG